MSTTGKPTIYFYWGNESLSFLRYLTIHSFSYYNPSYNLVLITKKNKTKNLSKKIWEQHQDYTYYQGADYTSFLDKVLNLTQIYLEDIFFEDFILKQPDNIICDLLKWYFLSREHCIFSDMDILFIKPISIRYDGITNGIFIYNNMACPAGFLYSKGTEFYKEIYQRAYSILKDEEVNHYQLIGPAILTCYIMNNKNHLFTLFPNDFIYPFINSYQGCFLKGEQWETHLAIPFISKPLLSDKCFGIHWYAGSTTAKKYNTLIDHTTYKQYDNLICNQIRECFGEVK